MAELPTAELGFDAGDGLFPAPVIDESSDRTRVTENWKINTRDAGRAYFAINLPQRDQLYDPTLNPTLRVKRRTFTPIAGTDHPATLVNGWCRCEVIYETESAVVLPIGQEHTLLGTRIVGQNIRVGLSNRDLGATPEFPDTLEELLGSGFPVTDPGLPIDGEKGMIRETGGLVYDIVSFPVWSDGYRESVQRLCELQAVNHNDINLPPQRGQSERITIKAGTARYLGLREDYTGGRLAAVHSLLVGEFVAFYAWGKRNDIDVVVGGVATQLYPPRPFTGLWNGV